MASLKLLSQPWLILIPKIKTNKNKQQYFTDNHYQWIASLNFIELPWCRKNNVKQIRASSGPGMISWFINITEIPSPRTLLDHSFSFFG